MFFSDNDLYTWQLQKEDKQLCAINYENGIQQMIISVDISDMKGEKGVWIFPVPSRPEETQIDIIKGFPKFQGFDVEESTNNRIFDTFSIMRLSQVYTFPVFILFRFGMAGSMRGPVDGITVFEHIEKMGLTTELITAEDQHAFNDYLTDRGLDIPTQSRSVIEEYTGEEYTFVVTWISDAGEFRNESMIDMTYSDWIDPSERMINPVAIQVGFPTEKIFFPLRPTSVYGDARIPILIYVTGHVTPELYPQIQPDTQVNYYTQSYRVPDELSNFFNGKQFDIKLNYTRIRITTESDRLVEDLWIKNSPPAKLVRGDFIENNLEVIGVLVFMLSSCLASMLAGMVTYRGDRPSRTGFGLFGLFNFLTLIGFAIAAYLMKIERMFVMEKKDVSGSDLNRTLKMCLVVSSIIYSPLLALFLIEVIYLDLEIFFFMLAIFIAIYIITLPFISLYYKNKNVVTFLAVFSVLFIIITWVFNILLIMLINW